MHDIEIKWWFFIFFSDCPRSMFTFNYNKTKYKIQNKKKQKQSKTKTKKSWFLNTRCTYSECRA